MVDHEALWKARKKALHKRLWLGFAIALSVCGTGALLSCCCPIAGMVFKSVFHGIAVGLASAYIAEHVIAMP